MTFTRINVDPNICQGQPTIRGTRITIAVILRMIASGMTSSVARQHHTGSLRSTTLPLSAVPSLATLSLSAFARKDNMNTITIDLSPETYKRLEEQAQRAGQAVEVWSRELLETALTSAAVARPRTTREVLQAAGRARPLSETLRSKILPGVTLDEVRAILAHAAGPSLSDIIQEQRGEKA
jgi:hypothetical protein